MAGARVARVVREVASMVLRSDVAERTELEDATACGAAAGTKAAAGAAVRRTRRKDFILVACICSY